MGLRDNERVIVPVCVTATVSRSCSVGGADGILQCFCSEGKFYKALVFKSA